MTSLRALKILFLTTLLVIATNCSPIKPIGSSTKESQDLTYDFLSKSSGTYADDRGRTVTVDSDARELVLYTPAHVLAFNGYKKVESCEPYSSNCNCDSGGDCDLEIAIEGKCEVTIIGRVKKVRGEDNILGENGKATMLYWEITRSEVKFFDPVVEAAEPKSFLEGGDLNEQAKSLCVRAGSSNRESPRQDWITYNHTTLTFPGLLGTSVFSRID